MNKGGHENLKIAEGVGVHDRILETMMNVNESLSLGKIPYLVAGADPRNVLMVDNDENSLSLPLKK